MRRSLVWDLLGVFLLSIYGTEVCPVLERVGAFRVSYVALAAFVVFELAYAPLVARAVDRGPSEAQTRRLYVITLARFLTVGLCLAVWDRYFLGVPWTNGFKVAAGSVTLGHFAGIDLALAKERALLEGTPVDVRGSTVVPEGRSLVRRLTSFAITTVALVILVVAFMVIRDIDVLMDARGAASSGVRASVVNELAVVFAIVTALVLNLISGFARNVALLFGHQTRVLAAIGRGELEGAVPVLTDDEFGVIAARTNAMIEGLRERRKVREALGKIVSPEVVRELLAGEDGLSLGGSRRTLTMLFSDIRGFTSWSEGTEPEVLVTNLNRYFTEMVKIVHEEGGVVDKFIGDGMMAVFGLGSAEGASLSAARAARRMLEAVERLNPMLVRPLKIGIGVHRGEVIAGNIGAPDRMEFTFIGDCVNTAARLESLTSQIGATVLVSGALLADVPEDERARWESRGAHPLKGKAEPFEVYGLRGSP